MKEAREREFEDPPAVSGPGLPFETEGGGGVEGRSRIREEAGLVRRVRSAMRQAAKAAGPSFSGHSPLERDVGALLDRLERLRRSFPASPELWERVHLSPHLMDLLEDKSRRAMPAEGGSVR